MVLDVAMNASGSHIFVGTVDGQIQCIDAVEGRPCWLLETGQVYTRQLMVDPLGQWVASAHEDNLVRLWSFDSGQFMGTLEGHSGHITALSVSADGSLIISADDRGQVLIWERDNWDAPGQTLQVGASVTTLAIHPEDGSLFVGTANGEVQIWTAPYEAASSIVPVEGSVEKIVFNEDPTQFTVFNLTALITVFSTDGTLLHRYEAHTDWARDGVYTAGGDVFISVGDDGQIIIWDVTLQLPIVAWDAVSTNVQHIALSADNRVLIATSENVVGIWQAREE